MMVAGAVVLFGGIILVIHICEREFNGVTTLATVTQVEGTKNSSYRLEFPVDGTRYAAWTDYVRNGKAGQYIVAVYQRGHPNNVAQRGAWGTTMVRLAFCFLFGPLLIYGGFDKWLESGFAPDRRSTGLDRDGLPPRAGVARRRAVRRARSTATRPRRPRIIGARRPPDR
jgi:hypothetical protein